MPKNSLKKEKNISETVCIKNNNIHIYFGENFNYLRYFFKIKTK